MFIFCGRGSFILQLISLIIYIDPAFTPRPHSPKEFTRSFSVHTLSVLRQLFFFLHYGHLLRGLFQVFEAETSVTMADYPDRVVMPESSNMRFFRELEEIPVSLRKVLCKGPTSDKHYRFPASNGHWRFPVSNNHCHLPMLNRHC